jgi:hypothetical protein
VEVVRRLMDTMRDRASEHIADFWEPDGDYYPVRKFPESRRCHGAEEIRSFMAEYESAWENGEFVVKERQPVGDDRVFLHGSSGPKGASAGPRTKETSRRRPPWPPTHRRPGCLRPVGMNAASHGGSVVERLSGSRSRRGSY